MSSVYDVIIIGGGAAGLSAALYTCRAMLKTLVIEQLGCGGQILVTDSIENYPGFPEGIKGPDLAKLFEDHASKYGTKIAYEQITGITLDSEIKTVNTNSNSYEGKTIIVASGGQHKKLGVPGEEEFSGKGVSYCAVCDGNFFRGQDVVVIGGGDAAIDEGLYLTGIVNSVTVIHRRDKLRASKILQQRAFENKKMNFKWNHVVDRFTGNGVVNAVKLKDLNSGNIYDYSTSAAFIYVGFESNSTYLKDKVSLDQTNHVLVDLNMATNVPGVYACGDIRTESKRQLGTAVGDGITAALAAYQYISEKK